MDEKLENQIKEVVSSLDQVADELSMRGDFSFAVAILAGRQTVRILATKLLAATKQPEPEEANDVEQQSSPTVEADAP